ncbi:M20/M25/M40 family metallo-hydrolase [Nevskia soli]|uniref:M20/M25/M40 family metallo-hydrolase n=1 Tax=Nevskia soli TaxID=418856 RepID=UPI0004A715E2|nr:M20/M25/M40 family metallo-hydrolase [Nevskia soli]
MIVARVSRCAVFLLAALSTAPAWSADAEQPAVDPVVLAKIRDAALSSDWAWQRLSDLTDKIGPRLSGSPGAEAAVVQVAAALQAAGLTVTLQPAKVPHWVRGEEQAELVDYPGHPAGLTQHLHLTTLGGSVATPKKGLTAPVLVVHSFDDLKAHAAEAKGRIVLFDNAFDQDLADNGHAMSAYGQAVAYRVQGASAAARVGAVASLIRSVGGADFRLPHTGVMKYEDDAPKIPTAALTAEDAMWVARLAAQGPVSLHLTLTPQTLPDADSHNVLADLPGSDKPDEVVVVSGHLDSWDLAQGAIDDGAGITAAMGAVQVLKSLGLQAHRTIRVVGWMNEENGSGGSKAYFAAAKDKLAQQTAVIESDSGAGKPLGVIASVTLDSLARLSAVSKALQPIGATALERRDGEVGADISPLQDAGVPGFAPMVDTREYFYYHHTAADTLDKIKPENLRRQVATMAVLAYYLAEMPEPLPRVPVKAE